MKFDLKKFLKRVKLNEENISMVLGAVVLVVVGVLVINYFKDKGSVNIPASSTNNASETASIEHTVVEGETLWSIAENTYGSGYNWIDIAQANDLSSDLISVGQKLVIPENITAKEPTTTAASQTDLQKSAVTEDDIYTVEKGDCLWDIAVRAYGDGYKWVDIAKVNNLDNPNIIHTGNVLTLPR